MGRLVRDPELRRTNSGKAVVSFTIACDKPGKDSGVSFVDCVAWEKTGEFISNFFRKGNLIALEGRLESRQYETKEGQKRTVQEVVVSQAHFCEKKKDQGIEINEPANATNGNFELIEDDGFLPF
jgi:single-strand DNA-binding protein